MRKEMEVIGCIEIPPEMTMDEFVDEFVEMMESKGWYFGGGFKEIIDGYYINPDGTKGKHVLEDLGMQSMNTISIESPDFTLRLQLKVFESDIPYPVNTELTVFVESDGFCASTQMDIDIKQFKAFVKDLSALYTRLQGNAKMQEPYGYQQFIEFSGDRTGHIIIRGELHSASRPDHRHALQFENDVDQTYLPPFINALTTFVQQFR